MNTQRPRGRPPADLETKLASLFDQPLELHDWPNIARPCWFGPQKVRANGKVTTVVRAMFMLIFGVDELHPTWKFTRICPNEDCRSPHHHLPTLINRKDGTPIVPLPERAYMPPAVEQPADFETEVDDAIYMILMVEDGRYQKPEFFIERWGHNAYSYVVYEVALRRIKVEGL